jgi:hypothetical protein
MAIKKIEFPQYSHSEKLRLIYDSDATREVRVDDTRAIDNGHFVLAWDSDNAVEDYPTLGVLCSVTQKRCLEMSYDVLCEEGYHIDFKHARLIDPQYLPFVVSSGTAPCEPKCVGRLVGFFFGQNDEAYVTVVDRNDDFFFLKPENVAYLDDVKFSIVKEEDNGNN